MKKVYLNGHGVLRCLDEGGEMEMICPTMSYRDADCDTIFCQKRCAWFYIADRECTTVFCRGDAIGELVAAPKEKAENSQRLK